MKVTYRIPTRDPYAYVEIETNPESILTKEITETYEELTRAFKGEPAGFGISAKDFNRIYDAYRLTGKIPAEDVPLYEEMDATQKASIGDLKRSFGRINQ